jgi:hypothetical protein
MILVFGFETTAALQQSTAAAELLERESQRIAKIKTELAKLRLGDNGVVTVRLRAGAVVSRSSAITSEPETKVELRTTSELKGHIGATEEDSFTITNATTNENTKVAYRDAEAVKGSGSTDWGGIAIWGGLIGSLGGLFAWGITHY